MSKDEVKRERKQMDGDPKIKAERKKLARELATSAAPAQRVGFANALDCEPDALRGRDPLCAGRTSAAARDRDAAWTKARRNCGAARAR